MIERSPEESGTLILQMNADYSVRLLMGGQTGTTGKNLRKSFQSVCSAFPKKMKK